MTDEERRIRSYLQAQGAKLSPAELIDKVRAAMEELRAALFSVPPARLAERPAADDWSADEVMAHVVSAGAQFGGGIARILDDGEPATTRGGPDGTAMSATEWWERLDRARTALFERVLCADPMGHLDQTIEHPMFGPLNWRETLLFLRLHDLDHAGQLRKIAAALG
ncbi:MAG TPA: DinB family protein [Methylomirabilota bacterium]|jgi:hypothetical protein|nr:DinB family protein [Methylomirabilota bacterium]